MGLKIIEEKIFERLKGCILDLITQIDNLSSG